MSQPNVEGILDQIEQLPQADRRLLEQRLASGGDAFADTGGALRTDNTGTVRIGRSRVTLDVVLADYRSGMTPEEIVRQLDTLDLADVYAAIAYYHRHRAEVDEYLHKREVAADALRREIEVAQRPGQEARRARSKGRRARSEVPDCLQSDPPVDGPSA
jgi:uncharacterized protein (DUF433 family)